MARKPAPTKANLFKAQKELRFATQGCELLHQKRDVLVMELMSKSAEFADAEKALREAMGLAFDAFIPACIASGRETMERVFASTGIEMSLGVKEHSVMGTRVPEVEMESEAEPVFPGLLDASIEMDAAVANMQKVTESLIQFVETVATIWRLATEIEKTQRRVNAIENVFIPESKAIVDWIKSVMEENDREELFKRKLLKNRSDK